MIKLPNVALVPNKYLFVALARSRVYITRAPLMDNEVQLVIFQI